MEHAHRHRRTQSLSCAGAGAASAASGAWSPHPSALRDTAESAPADIRPLRQSTESAAGFLHPLFAEHPARNLRPPRHADPVFAANLEEPLRALAAETHQLAVFRVR